MAGASKAAGLRLRALLAGLVAVVALAACAATFSYHGYVPTDEELAAIKVGRDSRDSVEEKIGRPTMAGMMRDDAWYYLAYTVRRYAYQAPQTVDRQLVAVSFRKDGRVANIERFTLEDGRVIALSRRVTETGIKGVGFIRQALGNLGRVDLQQVLGRNASR